MVLSVHGLNGQSGFTTGTFLPNRTVERYDPGPQTWARHSQGIPIDPRFAQYPWLHVLPVAGDPVVFFSGHYYYEPLKSPLANFAHKYDVVQARWTQVGSMQIPRDNRINGTSVLLPLVDVAPAAAEGGRILILGGAESFEPDSGIVNTAQIFCAGPTPHPSCTRGADEWQEVPPMPNGPTGVPNRRQHANVVTLPDGDVVVLGGEREGNCLEGQQFFCPSPLRPDRCDPVMEAVLYRHGATPPWIPVAQSPKRARQYHAWGMLLPDGSVAAGGGETDGICYQDQVPGGPTVEVYQPRYFHQDPVAAPRPIITPLAPAAHEVGYNQDLALEIDRPVGTNTRVVLLRHAAVTHSFNTEQRSVQLRFVGVDPLNPNKFTVRTPSNRNLAPPGYYLLFVVKDYPAAGAVPSVRAEFIRLRP